MAFLVMRAVYGHRYRRIVVFEAGQILAPDSSSAEVAVIDLMGKLEMYPLDVV